MTYIMTHFWPDGTQQQFEAVLSVVHPDGGIAPGQISRHAGPADGGYLIHAVWESKAAADSFVATGLMPHMPIDGGFAGAPVEYTAEVANTFPG